MKPDARYDPGFTSRNRPVELRDDALRQIEGLNLLVDREAAQPGCGAPVPAYHAAHQALVPEVARATGCAIALACRVEEREGARETGSQKSPFYGLGYRLGVTNPKKTCRCDGPAVLNQRRRVVGILDLHATRPRSHRDRPHKTARTFL